MALSQLRVCSYLSDIFILGSRLKDLPNGERTASPTIVLRASAGHGACHCFALPLAKSMARWDVSGVGKCITPQGGTASHTGAVGTVWFPPKEEREQLGAIITIHCRLRNDQTDLAGGRGGVGGGRSRGRGKQTSGNEKYNTVDPWTTHVWTVWIHLHADFSDKYIPQCYTICGCGTTATRADCKVIYVNFWQCRVSVSLTLALFKGQVELTYKSQRMGLIAD